MANQPKKYKKYLATAATATLVASAIAPVASANELVFPDMAGYHPDTIALVEDLAADGIIVGSNGKFNPQGDVSRKHAVLIIGRYLESLGLEASEGVKQFDDVDGSDREFARLALLVRDLGIFNGNALEELDPSGKFTRQNMALVIDRVFQLTTGKSLKEIADEQGKTGNVADINKVKDEAKEAVLGANALGLSKVATFNPEGTAKRVHFAQFFYVAVPILEANLDLAVSVDAEIKAVVEATKALPAANTVTAANAAAAQTAVNTLNTAIKALEDAVKEAGDDLLADDAATAAKAVADGKAAAKAVQDAIEATVKTEVVSVNAINAAQIQVNFNKAISKDSVIDTDGTLKANVLNVAKVSGTGNVTVTDASLATLSADGKTLTVNAATGAFNNVAFVLTTTKDVIKTTDNVSVPEYTSGVINASDKIAPTVVNVERQNASTVRVYFSEPLSNAGNYTFKLANGNTTTDVNVDNAAANLAKGYVELTVGSSIAAGAEVTATVIGATDVAGNVANPNPFNVSFSRGQLDGIPPTVSSITPTSLNSFEIKFSEEVQGFNGAALTVDGMPRTADNGDGSFTGAEAKVVQDTTDKTKYTVTLATPVTAGLRTVAIAAASVNDLSGETNAAYSRVVTFSADTTAPTLTASQVLKNAAGKEVLRLTFSEDVTAGNLTAVPATQVRNYVTTNGTLDLSAGSVSATNAREFTIELEDAKFTPTGGSAGELQAGATYSATLTGGFTDTSSNTNALETTRVTFTRGTDALTVAQSVTSVTQTANNPDEVAVVFAQPVDGASATNEANYTIQGVVVEDAEVRAGSENTVYLTLKSGSNTLSGTRNVTINNVKTRDGVVMANAYTGTVNLEENVAPTFTAALTQPNKITLTFSENVQNVIESGSAVADFDVFIGNTNVTTLRDGGSNVTVTEGGTDREKIYTLTLSRDLTAEEAAQIITVRPATNNDVKDLVNNELSFTSVTVTR